MGLPSSFRPIDCFKTPGIVAAVKNDSSLVHSDFNQKNILARKWGDRWIVSGLLDWEFAFSGSPLLDFGNFFRFEEELPSGYLPALTDSYVQSGGTLPPDWRRISKFLDLINHLIFLTAKEERPKTFATARRIIEQTLRSWD